MFVALVPFISALVVSCDSYKYNNIARHSSYDYVVVGAGSAGSPLASELSKDGKFTVLLLEAGGPPPPMSEVPIFVPKLAKTSMEWTNYTEPQNNVCLQDPERRCRWNTAKTLGGCSSHNHMLFVRGNKWDFDNWERLGAKGWNYESVLKTFKKIENFTIPEHKDNGYHGVGGLVTISPQAYPTKLGDAFLEAGVQQGYNIVDYNGPSQMGFSRTQVNQRDGLRLSTEKAFLRPAANRENLDILTYAFVHKVTFDDQKTVKSVIFDHEGQLKEIQVNKEVILSAGSLSSPKILMLSGIGPKEHLEDMKIPVVVDLPGVGQNLQDHLLVTHLNYLLNESVGIVPQRDVNPDTIGELVNKGGPMTTPGFVEIVGFVNSSCPKCNSGLPDTILIIGTSSIFTPLPTMDLTNVDVADPIPLLLRAESRGELKLRSANPNDDPVVDPKYYSHPDDMKRSIAGVKITMSVMETPALQRYSPKLTPEILPGCENLGAVDSDEYIECAIRNYFIAGFHFTGSCKMGDPADNSTVLDPELRVKGVKGLRVADASIMPESTTGNLNAPCMMIGQRAADMILSGAN